MELTLAPGEMLLDACSAAPPLPRPTSPNEPAELVVFLVQRLRDHHDGDDVITKLTSFEAGKKAKSWVGDSARGSGSSSSTSSSHGASGGGGGGGGASSLSAGPPPRSLPPLPAQGAAAEEASSSTSSIRRLQLPPIGAAAAAGGGWWAQLALAQVEQAEVARDGLNQQGHPAPGAA